MKAHTVLAVVFVVGAAAIAIWGAGRGARVPGPPRATRAPASAGAAGRPPQVAAAPSVRPRLTGNPPVVSGVPTKRRVVFLTIDDGWDRDPAFPALLRRLRVPVTLFLANTAIAGHDGYFRELRAAGADIEDHTLTHRSLVTLGPAAQRREICGAADLYARRFGRRPTLLRPPFGTYDAAVRARARACGMKAIVLWRDSVQHHGKIAYQAGRLRPGDVILLHFRPHLARDLPIVLATIRRQGMEVGRLGDYVG